MAGFMFNVGAHQLALGTTIWGTSTIRARLVTVAAGAPDKDADVMTGIGSAQASATVSVADAVAPTKSDTNDRISYPTTGGLSFPAAALAIGACDRVVLYRFVTNDADSVPIVCIDIAAVTPNGGDVAVAEPTTDGVLGWFYTQE